MTLFASREDRTVRGLLLPYGEASRLSVSGAEPVVFSTGTVKVPRTVKHLNANIGHDRYTPVASFESVEETDRGLEAVFNVADSDEGDELFAAIDAGRLTRLSAEVRALVRKGAAAVSAVLTGAAFVEEGAFESAALFAIGDVTEELETTLGPDEEGHLAVLSTEMPADVRVTTPEGETATYTPEASPAEDTPNENGEFAVTNSIVPDGVVTPEATNKVDTSTSALFSALATNARTQDRSVLAPFADVDADRTGLFALADITATGTAATVQSQFVGDLWKGKQFTQRVLPLFNHENLTALKVEGWRWTTAPEVGAWAGDKAEVPSNAVAFGQTSVTAERIAGAHDIDRALRDFSNESFWSGYFKAMTTSYAKVADAKVLNRIIAAPNAANGIGSTVVTPGTVPTGVDPGVAAIVDGALAVVAAGYTPTFALVSTAIYRNLLLTPKDKILEFLTSAMGLEEGSLAGFKIIPHATLAAKRVIVGSKDAATVYELPGSPIRVEGLDIARGGIDPAVYGYIATVVNDVTGLASVTTA